MLVLAIALVLGCEGGSMSEPDGGPPFEPACTAGRCVYVVSALRAPREGAAVPGLDLDGRVSDEADETGCLKPDYVAPDGRQGIDNQFTTMVGTLEEALSENVDDLLREAITSGELLFVVELIDGEGMTTVEWGAAELPAGSGALVSEPTGELASDQTFVRSEPAHAGQSSIRGDVVEAPLGDVTVALAADSTTTIELPLRQARLRVPFDDGLPATGTLSGRLWIEDLLVTVPDLDPDSPSLLRATLERQADLDPDAAGVCQSISIAFAMDLVPARLEP